MDINKQEVSIGASKTTSKWTGWRKGGSGQPRSRGSVLSWENNINPVVLYLLVYFCEITVEHGKALSLLAHAGDGIHNIAVSEKLIWSPVGFSWCPEYILQ